MQLEGYYPNQSNVLRMLGYFSLIGLMRVHALIGDYHTALKGAEREWWWTRGRPASSRVWQAALRAAAISPALPSHAPGRRPREETPSCAPLAAPHWGGGAGALLRGRPLPPRATSACDGLGPRSRSRPFLAAPCSRRACPPCLARRPRAAVHPINLNPPHTHLFTPRILGAHITLLYYAGFSYMMLGRYLDATRVLSSVLAHINRVKQYHVRSQQYDQVRD